MAKEYRIYPGIGIARVGNSPDSFFLSAEIPGLGPLELTANDSVQPVTRYKDENRMLKRQAARFRVFERDSGGSAPTDWREVNLSTGAQIEWRAELANEKAAAGRFSSEAIPEDIHQPRNPGIPQAELIIAPEFPAVSGANQTAKARSDGKFKGTTVYLGELRTDHEGRLIILGGMGTSKSVPPGLPVGGGSAGPGHSPNNFANNEGWHDDVADGPISATIRIAGQPDVVISNGAWVIVAPPDFAPYCNGVTTLYDIAAQAAGIKPPQRPSFQQDVLPILQAASRLKYVSSLSLWAQISTDYQQLATSGNANADELRQDTLGLLLNIEAGVLQNFQFTANQHKVLDAWAAGNFVADFIPNPAPANLTADGLDQASLSQAVGGGFFPGIEASIRMTAPQMYSQPFRITSQPFEFNGVLQAPHAGFITRTMACPWQSDFFDCTEEITGVSAWWPAQRPIEVQVDAHNVKPWIDSISNHQALVDKFWKLGVIERPAGGAQEPLIESERDPTVAHQA